MNIILLVLLVLIVGLLLHKMCKKGSCKIDKKE